MYLCLWMPSFPWWQPHIAVSGDMHACVCICIRMSICMYTCIYLCMYVCMYVCMNKSAYVYLCLWMPSFPWWQPHIAVSGDMHACVCICIRMSICMYTCIYLCMYVCMYVRMNKSAYVYLCLWMPSFPWWQPHIAVSGNMHMCVCVCIRVFIYYICIYVCMYV